MIQKGQTQFHIDSKKWGMTTIEIRFGAILDESGEIFGIAFLRFGIEIELFSSEKLENDTNFS